MTHSGQEDSSQTAGRAAEAAGGGAGPKRAKTFTQERPLLSPSLPPFSGTRSSPFQILYLPPAQTW